MAERYAAFISYSHRDQRIAAWLQRAIEGYRVPAYIVGRPGAFGEVPARLGAVFRDREDLPASADLAASVRAALFASDALIVLCSPEAARSRWVDAEIAQFKARAGEDRVFALIVSGEPFAGDTPGRGGEECMPLSLRRRVAADGTVTDEVVEPMAADLRDEGEGKRLARSKIIAGLLGIPLDMLIRREHARRQRSWMALAAASMLGMMAMGGLALEAVRARDAARARRADAEQLVDFMLGDLRKRLDAVGRLDVLDAVGAQTMRYYGRQDLGSLNADELARRARALRLVGELRSMRGDFGPAAAAFQQAAATTGELMAREPGNGQRVFDHAQSVFWVGSLAFQRGDRATAAPAFDAYVHLADRLVTLDPKKDDWQAEVAYSRSNRGTSEMAARRIDAAALDFGEANRTWAALLARHPGNAGWRDDYADALAWLADAERFRGNLAAATEARQRELAIDLALVASDPLDTEHQQSLAWTRHALGDLAMDRGEVPGALAEYEAAARIMDRLLGIEPKNVDNVKRSISVDRDLAEAYHAGGREAAADTRLQSARARATHLLARDPTVLRWRQAVARADLVAASIALDRADLRTARWLLVSATEQLETNTGKDDGWDEAIVWRARERELHARIGDVGPNAWAAVADVFGRATPALSLDETCVLRDAYANLGRAAEATALTRRLTASGYARPGCASIPKGSGLHRSS